jgi:hypothetical protein
MILSTRSRPKRRIQFKMGGAIFLTLLMIILNICGTTCIPWLWVFAPIWVILSFFLAGIVLFAIAAIFVDVN